MHLMSRVETAACASVGMSHKSHGSGSHLKTPENLFLAIWQGMTGLWKSAVNLPLPQLTIPELNHLSGRAQVFHVTASHIACVQLVPDMEPDYEHSRASLTCRWDPSGRFVVVLSKWNGYDMGPAIILDAKTASCLHSCRIRSAASWPQWPSLPSLSFPADSLSPRGVSTSMQMLTLSSGIAGKFMVYPNWCLAHEANGLVTFSGTAASWTSCGHRWSHLSPDGSLITTLLVDIDFVSVGRSAKAFQHHQVASGSETSVMLPNGSDSGQPIKSQPFLVTWLPGTQIYAAAAFGFIYIVDGQYSTISKMWPADGFQMGDVEHGVSSTSPHDVGWGGISWSPDRSAVVWLYEEDLRMVTF